VIRLSLKGGRGLNFAKCYVIICRYVFTNMTFHKKLALIQEMVDNAMSSIRSAQTLLNELVGKESSQTALELKLASVATRTIPEDDAPVYVGIFNGERMMTNEGEDYPVPANYASKSKLVEGDELKLIIADDGRFIYKQIGPVDRDHVVGTLVKEDERYKVLANGKAYNVLMAAVTYYKAEIGDKITLLVPANQESLWGAIDNVIPVEDFIDDSKDEEDVF